MHTPYDEEEQGREQEDRLCLQCADPIDSEWAQSTQRFCSLRCKNAAWYLTHKDHHRKLYAEKKRRWERSPTGRQGGVPIRQWLRLPEDWQ